MYLPLLYYFKAVVCRLYEMLYPCICNVVISCWKSGAYGFVICRGGTDMCFVPGSGWKHLDLEQYRISGLTHRYPDKRGRKQTDIKAQKFHLSNLFPNEEKHLTPIRRAHHESPRCSLPQRSVMCSSDHSHSRESRVLPQPNARQNIHSPRSYGARVSGAPSPQE